MAAKKNENSASNADSSKNSSGTNSANSADSGNQNLQKQQSEEMAASSDSVENKSDAQLIKETREEAYVQGEEIKGTHLKGQELEGGTKADSIKRKLAGKKAARDGGDVEKDSYGREVQNVIVHPHREKQPHRIEQEFPEVEIVYGPMDEDKVSLLAEAHAKGVYVDHSQENDELRAEIDRVESDRQAQLDDFENLQAQVRFPSKAYYNNQLLEFDAGEIVEGDLARRLVDQHIAEEV